MIEEIKLKIQGILMDSEIVSYYEYDETDKLYDCDFIVGFDNSQSLDDIKKGLAELKNKVLDLKNVEVTILEDQLEDSYADNEPYIDLYIDEINPNHWVWFNIGQKGDCYVQWQCAVINRNFDPRTLLLESYEWDEDGNPTQVWVSLDEFKMMPKSVAPSFNNSEKVAKAVARDFHGGEEVYMGHKNWTHIYALFDMGDKNEYGVAKNLWEDY